jgi:4-hydroxybenzoate polyprenyltransferase
VSNLPTVWTNVLAGIVLSGGTVELRSYVALAAGVSFLYTAGMFLNDAFDLSIDARTRPERPLPSGDVDVREVVAVGSGLLATGTLVLAWAGRRDWPWAIALATAIVYYDYRHKRDSLGPVVMGLCRALVYCVAGAATGGVVAAVLIGAAAMWAYVTGLTLVSKRMGPRARIIVPRLLAGISILDGLLIAPFSPALAPAGLVGFALTLAGQRWVPGD